MKPKERNGWLSLAVFAAIVVAVMIVFAGLTNKAFAGEEEATVIQSSIEATFDTAIENDEWTASDFDTHVADLEELWIDTEIDSYCETYASVGFFIAKMYDAAAEQDEEYAAAINAAIYIMDDLPRLNTACLQEGY